MIDTKAFEKIILNTRKKLGLRYPEHCEFGIEGTHDWNLHGKPLSGRTYYACLDCGKLKRRGNDLLPSEYERVK